MTTEIHEQEDRTLTPITINHLWKTSIGHNARKIMEQNERLKEIKFRSLCAHKAMKIALFIEGDIYTAASEGETFCTFKEEMWKAGEDVPKYMLFDELAKVLDCQIILQPFGAFMVSWE